MSKEYTLTAEKRSRVGKGSSRALRRQGLIPAIIYGEKVAPLSIAVSYKEIYYKIYGGNFLTSLITIELGKEKIQVLPKDYQLDPVRDFPLHVDFLRVSAKSIVNVYIPVHFINEEAAPGIKRGGVLTIIRHEIECLAPATAIPSAFTIDLSGYAIGDAIHFSDISLPEGVTIPETDHDLTIATITAPVSEDTQEETAEGEGKAEEESQG